MRYAATIEPLRLPSPPTTTIAKLMMSGSRHMNGSSLTHEAKKTPAIPANAPEIAQVSV
ncbi:hypothetical protein HRbin07_00687 [bacterium HR07]|nr:hypothetical protein HRbin07_00687 [bacterium HR07]